MRSGRAGGVKKILLAVLLFVVIAGGAILALAFFHTPTPELAWVKLSGTPADDFAYSAAVDPKGNVFAAGSSSGAFVENASSGYRDLVLLKLDSGGNNLWTRQFGTSSWDEAYSVTVDGKGGVYAAGYTYGGLGGNMNSGKYDIFLAKYDDEGKRLWARQAGTREDDYAYSVSADGKGNVYVAGYTYGSLDAENAGGADVFLMKFDPEGNRLWTRQFGTPSDDVAYSSAVDANGNAYIAGYTGGGLDGNKYSGSWDAFVSKFDPEGKKLWTKQLGTPSWEEAWAVVADSDGNAYIAGYTGGDIGGKSPAKSFDAFIAKYDPSGKEQWIKRMGTPENDYAHAIAVDANGNAYIAGYTGGEFKGAKNAGGDDIFVSSFSPKGRKLWVRQFGSPQGDYSFGVAVDASGNIYLSGETSGVFGGVFGGASGGAVGGAATGNGGYDIFVLKLNAPDTSFMARLSAFFKDILKKPGLG